MEIMYPIKGLTFNNSYYYFHDLNYLYSCKSERNKRGIMILSIDKRSFSDFLLISFKMEMSYFSKSKQLLHMEKGRIANIRAI